MKADLKLKFLQSFNQYINNENSRQINLLVVSTIIIAIIGILPAIALPSYLSQLNIKAAQAEARQTLMAMNAAQQAYYLRNNQFLKTMGDFQKFSGLSIKTATVNYTYDVVSVVGVGVVNLAKPPLRSQLFAYAGGVGKIETPGTTKYTTATVLCESKVPGLPPSAGSITFTFREVKCNGADFQDVK
ncbi:type IV pilin-like G/H family protein [Microseira wollei]|uniref:General secretion pathway protein G n=1 Tax=Microseira wollei NIES-4236 TaxID=2530354 RepID=A0AAV3XUC3_9CYAN|nr:type IV pilin-like G/H family protein [Microseira wollei]GET44007.1 general secretion pathway protein G [Microseira wollei NIES-4236]